jgi:hypothetical protein
MARLKIELTAQEIKEVILASLVERYPMMKKVTLHTSAIYGYGDIVIGQDVTAEVSE